MAYIGDDTHVVIPNSVTTIGKYAFSGCKNLVSVSIPNSVTTIENSAFQSCDNLVAVSLPDGITSIEDVRYVILEPNGKLSVFPYKLCKNELIPLPLIVEGNAI